MAQNEAEHVESAGHSHKMSIAATIGATIALIGLVILLYGVFGSPDFSRTMGINFDLWWGLAMFIFGILMGGGGYLSSRRALR